MRVRASIAAGLLLIAGFSRATAQEAAPIDFPTSGNAPAQALFLKGLLALHAFDYDSAREAFVAAQKAQPEFAMAYWGEAMTYNHPLWHETSPDLAKTALTKLAPTPAARLAKASTAREKDWLNAVEKLYAGTGPSATQAARDLAYADAMKRMADRYPNDDEVKTFYALALLGTSESGRDTATAMKAAAILEMVAAKNPRHPGAVHYLIHAYDDPEHAAQALKYADAYAEMAPAAAHALHMPSHTYFALGMWDRASAANERSMKAADALRERGQLDVGQGGLDAMLWLVYSYAQQGRYSDARAVLDHVESAARESGSVAARSHLARARAAWLVETRKWADVKAPVDATALPKDAAAAELFALGFAAVRAGNRGLAATAMQQMAQLMEETPVNLAPVRTPGTSAKPGISPIKPAPGPRAVTPPGVTPIAPDAPEVRQAPQAPLAPSFDRRVPQVMAQQLEAAILFSEGRREEAIVLARQAAVVEALLAFEVGPPVPVKPVNEQVGEMLMDVRRPKDAMEAFQLSLKRHPRRALSLLGLARAATLARDPSAAQSAYNELREVWRDADPTLPELREVANALMPKPSSR